MSEPADQNDPVVVANELISTLGGMTKQFEALSQRQVDSSKYSHHTRRLGIGLAASVFLDIILSIVVVFSLIGQVHQNTTFRNAQVTQNKVTVITAYNQCVANNTTRAQDISIWKYVLAHDLTIVKSQPAAITETNRLIAAKDTPRNCAKLYPH